MNISVLSAVVIALCAMWAATGAVAGPCAHDKSRNCLDVPATVNFSSVPEISNQIVNQEKIQPGPAKNPAEDASKPYTGPMIGTNPRPGRTPTVGYYWSLE
ncbi:MAG: hypothetical protein JO081_07285 [Alphaproteobacteria bacterium]|nr:hypothetical protein [Alphaproteobacteria bacterium]